MTHVFISHSSQDADFVEKHIRKPLEEFGLETWYAKDKLGIGQDFQPDIERALETCKWFLIVFTPNSVTSKPVRHEVDKIWQRYEDGNVKILPVLVEECEIERLDPRLTNLNWADFRNTSVRKGELRKLIRGCIASLQESVTRQDEISQQLEEECLRLREEMNDLTDAMTHLRERTRQLASHNGQVWRRASDSTTMERQEKSDRRARIISIANVKGGVGKTTVTHILSWALHQLGRRVLLIDLDHQGSLSRRCLTRTKYNEMIVKDKLISRLFVDEPDFKDVYELVTAIDDDRGRCIIGAHEKLQHVEESAQIRWIVDGGSDDVRYRLSQALHVPSICQEFDFVLLDCPPRLTTAYINGIAASDYLLIPVVLDNLSVEGIPRQIGSLERLINGNAIPFIELLGVVANNSSSTNLSESHWEDLPNKYSADPENRIHRFETRIPPTTDVAKFDPNSNLMPFPPKLRELFKQFGQEVCDLIAEKESIDAIVAT